MKKSDFKKLCDSHHLLRMAIMRDERKSRTADSDDRLLQFKRLANLHRVSPAEICMHLCSKHFCDLIDMADGTHPKHDDLDYLRELIADVQNYMDLLNAIETERLLGGEDYES